MRWVVDLIGIGSVVEALRDYAAGLDSRQIEIAGDLFATQLSAKSFRCFEQQTGDALMRGVSLTWLSVIVLIPLAAVVAKSFGEGPAAFWEAISQPEAVAAIKLTVISSLVIVVINAVMGTLIAWVLVRDDFRGKSIVNSIIDLPFALPTIVAGLT